MSEARDNKDVTEQDNQKQIATQQRATAQRIMSLFPISVIEFRSRILSKLLLSFESILPVRHTRDIATPSRSSFHYRLQPVCNAIRSLPLVDNAFLAIAPSRLHFQARVGSFRLGRP